MLTLWNPFNVFKYGLTGVFLFIDGIVYWCVSKLFSIYVAIAGAEIITSDMYNEIVQKFEVIIGVFMLFYIAYALLKALINPDELSKNTTAIVKNFIISIVLLTVIPVIFAYAFKIQNIIIHENKIAVLLLGDQASTSIIESTGNTAAWTTLTAFLKVDGDVKGDNIEDNELVTWKDLEDSVKEGDSEGFLGITSWVDPIHHNQDADYIPIISTLCGGFLIYILISFCLDLGIRIVKLAFYQTIAPIPIMMRIIPEKKSVFDNWIKATLNTYLEVFIRIFIMFFVIYLIDLIIESGLKLNSTSGNIGTLGLVFIILGLFAFAKQAPKLIGDVIGIDAGNLKLGIKDKLSNNYLGGKALVGAAGVATGLATGFLGGALSAKMNGGSFIKGGLAGGVNGSKGRGNQFGKQRQAIYSMSGGKGKAGFFGGRSFFDTQLNNIQENAKKDMKDAYKAGQQKNIDRFENSKDFQDYMKTYKNNQVSDAKDAVIEAERLYNAQVRDAQNKVDNAKNLIDENRKIRSNFENSAEYNGIMASYYNQAALEADKQMRQTMHEYSATPEGRAKFQSDRETLIRALQNQYAYQYLSNNADMGISSEAGQKYIEAINKSKELDGNLVNAYKELAKVQYDSENLVEEAEQHLTEVKRDNETSYEEARKYFTTGDGSKTKASKTYKSSVEYIDKAQQEKEIKEYLKSDAGQRAVATQKEALKAIDEENKKKGGAAKSDNNKK